MYETGLSDYFDAMDAALVEAGTCQPVLVIDRARLDHNLAVLKASSPVHMDLRIVSKSLPSLDLLRYVTASLGSERLMTFNLPMLSSLAREFPEGDQLLGKPFPVRAAAQFYQSTPEASGASVQWLIDTNERLAEYAALGRDMDLVLKISIELDIGLHRGGFNADWGLRLALNQIVTSPHLEFAGFMGYEAHLAKMPAAGGIRRKAFESALGIYEQAVAMATTVFGDRAQESVLNSAGSLTFGLHADGSIANEMSIGTALLKGTDFDTDLLTGFEPAVFIATPAIKVLETAKLPGLDVLDRLANRFHPARSKALFIHGGHWLAEPVHPEGLSYNSVFGRSSNQEMLNAPNDVAIQPDDFVFLRPTQTEAVLMQFGDIAVYDDGKIVDTWQSLPASA